MEIKKSDINVEVKLEAIPEVSKSKLMEIQDKIIEAINKILAKDKDFSQDYFAACDGSWLNWGLKKK